MMTFSPLNVTLQRCVAVIGLSREHVLIPISRLAINRDTGLPNEAIRLRTERSLQCRTEAVQFVIELFYRCQIADPSRWVLWRFAQQTEVSVTESPKSCAGSSKGCTRKRSPATASNSRTGSGHIWSPKRNPVFSREIPKFLETAQPMFRQLASIRRPAKVDPFHALRNGDLGDLALADPAV